MYVLLMRGKSVLRNEYNVILPQGVAKFSV
ncbi:hypothetical protein BTT_23720 [Bacillus thuringiensis serovar morrisoni str. 4AA1]|uniref:Uncharacterized protein n=4 Tax=Bacillus cereus group TaxID=86661 RepID=A0A9W5VLY6_BACCE|nr:hypothetical protein AS86_1768 [Bacillus thuringiensis HD1002]EJP90013.1 hypothetical protein IC1_02723 [Bacillus cereus VD022]EJR05933.1 hypothetical protein II5_02760 [Bacillus cereus MSX-A1]EOO08007.1 hypothetical protein IAW_02765 [Bacillus cereus str. Schrouff]EOO85300.1 hypothetical protein IGY_03380 [Bacillus cereus K-5975c]EOP89391.1 hypothetical protein IGM_02649 [Bacillus cereus HuB4-4]EOQ64476.1 hypothetical protein IAY_03115 [Bacillus cereus TIAC219]KIP24667.1 hypothetical pro